MTFERSALLLVGHGTRSQAGTEQFLALAKRVASSLAPLPVEPAFLELQQPDIDAAVGRLATREVSRLVTLPLLLFAAGHAKQDIPDAVGAALARRGLGHVEQLQMPHLGCHPAVVELSRRRMDEVLAEKTPVAARETCLLLVGRGSRDESATAEMHEFAHLRRQVQPEMHVAVAFLTMAQPLLQNQLAIVASHNFRRVIVQPHLLFQGELLAGMEEQVTQARDRHPGKEWLVTWSLADAVGIITSATGLIQKVISDRCLAAGIRVVAAGGDD
jgi:sirohydrochlorin cobaltochelatase